VPPIDSRGALAAGRDETARREEARAPSSSALPRTPLFIVASPRPQVGKTFLARLLTDFLSLDGGSVFAFEIEPGTDALADYLPDISAAATIGDTQGEMALFDNLVLEDGVARVLDLGGPAYRRFFDICGKIGFFAECGGRAIEPMILFAADDHRTACAAYADLRERFPDTLVVPVFNEAISKGGQFRHKFPFERAASVPLRIPYLAPALKALTERPRFSFAEFHGEAAAGLPRGNVFHLRAWTRRAFLEFRELELRLLLEKLRSALLRGPL
jgi:hypothetical protein